MDRLSCQFFFFILKLTSNFYGYVPFCWRHFVKAYEGCTVDCVSVLIIFTFICFRSYIVVFLCSYISTWNRKYLISALTNWPHFNPLLHRYSFLHLLQQTTFENNVRKEEIAPACFQSFPTWKCSFLSAEWTFKIF